jgi:hypothetical protein
VPERRNVVRRYPGFPRRNGVDRRSRLGFGAWVSTRRSARLLATHFCCSPGGLANLSSCRPKKLRTFRDSEMVPTMNSFGRSAHPIAHSLSVLLLSLMLSDWCLKATRRECPIVRNPGDEHALRKTALVTGASRGISRRGGVHRRSGVLIHYRVESYR